MEPAYFVMAILGCADDGLQCRQERIEPIRYQSAAACQSAIDTALQRNSDLSYPMVGAACQRAGEQVVESKPAARRG